MVIDAINCSQFLKFPSPFHLSPFPKGRTEGFHGVGNNTSLSNDRICYITVTEKAIGTLGLSEWIAFRSKVVGIRHLRL